MNRWKLGTDRAPGPEQLRQFVLQLCSFAGEGAELFAALEAGR
ncbi:hypothetical protein [Kitasatospora indigofera]